jgi:transcriptional regulator with XRE-family HTH domain
MPRKERLEMFGAELRKRRESLGMDQKVLAARIGISAQHLSQIETAYSKEGRSPVGPSDEVIEGVSRELGWKTLEIRKLLGQLTDDDAPSDPLSHLITVAAYNHDNDGLTPEETLAIKARTEGYIDRLVEELKQNRGR